MKFLYHLWQNFREYAFLIVLVIISLYLISINTSPQIQKLRAMIFSTFAVVNSFFNDTIDSENLKEEVENLRLTNAELMLQLSRLRKDMILIDNLKNSLSLKDTFKFKLISSQIISRFNNLNQETITINDGKKNGVEIGMPVINDRGLVGVVFSVSDNYAIIKTLRNSDLNLTVKSEKTGEQGVLKWKSGNLRIINVPKTYQIKKGDRIVISELSTIVPVIVPVGYANSIENIEKGIFNEIIVNTLVDFNNLEYVFIVPIVASKEVRNLELNFLKKLQ
ncbi:MAG: rod shape-determining protein MreC [Ignavibacterium sp.]|nr:rod shape-determining protein MreC [Ignavibacterium sp.]MDW8376388.1 rod shape-determining protein MreC [Ignavibacteriales bacterium]